MVVQHNMTAINANRYFGINNNKLSKSLEKLSSGYAINRAGDNAAGLAVSEKMRSQIAGINQGVKNAQ
ncbi:MAG: flagellin protein, partial [Oscillospiraceae bacterium]